MRVIEAYLPKQLTQEEIEAIVDETIKETGAESAKAVSYTHLDVYKRQLKGFGRVLSGHFPQVVGQVGDFFVSAAV